MWGIGAVFGPVLGPILGSIATEAYDWRAAFFIIVPPGLCALVCIWFALRDHTARDPVKFDWTGFIALSVAMAACAQLIFDRGHRLDWFEFDGDDPVRLHRRGSRSGSSSCIA